MRREYLIGIALAGASLALVFLLGEGALRLFKPSPVVLDSTAGWRARENFHRAGTERDSAGQQYEVSVTQDHQGFRYAGDRESPRPKVLVLGDSYTHATEVSDDKTYYALLAERLPAEVFAYGVRGYSTLQELMALERYGGEIGPDIVVVQLCANDFIDNALELERESILNNQRFRRPYLADDGSIVYALPARWPGLRAFANRYSRLLKAILIRLDMLLDARRVGESVEYAISAQGEGHPGFQRSAATTGKLLRRIRQRVPEAKMLAFCEATEEPYFSAFERLCREAGIPFAKEVPEALDRAKAAGEVIHYADGAHWNERGHAIVAEALSGRLQELLGE